MVVRVAGGNQWRLKHDRDALVLVKSVNLEIANSAPNKFGRYDSTHDSERVDSTARGRRIEHENPIARYKCAYVRTLKMCSRCAVHLATVIGTGPRQEQILPINFVPIDPINKKTILKSLSTFIERARNRSFRSIRIR